MQEGKAKTTQVSSILAEVVDMEGRMKNLALQINDIVSSHQVMMSAEDEKKLETLIHSTESFRMFARDMLEEMGKKNPKAKRWADALFMEDCHAS
jgi:hypothetical protein